jgi:amino-acid N-acetyltransferase
MHMVATVYVRKAELKDIDTLHELIQNYANQGIMLPRSKDMLAEHIDTFMVAEIDQTLVGCGALTRLGPDLIEIRSLGISHGYKGQGIGSQLIESLLHEARNQNVKKVMALTYEVAFFQKNGFDIVPKHIFPEKVWKDCMSCKKQYCCDEIAVLKRLD